LMSQILDGAVFPGTQGGPLENVIAAKAVAFREALTEEYTEYVKNVIENSKTLSENLKDAGYKIVSNGTDNHCFLVDLRNKNITGKQAENLLIEADITVNKNMLPFDEKSPFITSGIRIGTPAITTRGLRKNDMSSVAEWIVQTLESKGDSRIINDVKLQVKNFMKDRPLFYQELNEAYSS